MDEINFKAVLFNMFHQNVELGSVAQCEHSQLHLFDFSSKQQVHSTWQARMDDNHKGDLTQF